MPIVQSKYRAHLSHSEPITANQLIVEYDNESYQVEKDSDGGYGNRGLMTNSSSVGLPFYIISGINNQTAVYTNSAGQHTIDISEYTSKVETTECFKKAVKSVDSGVMMLNHSVSGKDNSINGATWQEAYNALQDGTMVFLTSDGVIFSCSSFDASEIIFVHIEVLSGTSATAGVTAYVYIWGSDGTITYIESTYPPQS